ncbi:MAG: glycoside hydrolase family 5 protein [Deltaproteobacteria bacterium]|nr:glycoside hydrolase family 5 protein [Deltaproteobacteria bacterium]
MSATEIAAAMGVGTNIGNTLENTYIWETGWGQPMISQAYIDGMAANGIGTVRVPVAWDTFAVDGVIQADKMNRVREVVDMIVGVGMYCVLNIHWDGGWIFNEGTADAYTLTNDVRTKFQSYWEQISAEFADVGYQLVFEGMNEEGRFYVGGNESGTPDYAPLNELNQLFVTTVRASTGFNQMRNLLIAGFQTDIERTCVNEFQIPTDPAGSDKLLLSLHYYTPYPWTLMSEPADWGGMVYPRTTWGTTDDYNELNNLFNQLATFSNSRNVPIILGEFAVTLGEGSYVREQSSRVLWMTEVMQTCLNHGMVPLLWDTGQEINRTDGGFTPEFTQVMENLGI